MGSSAGGAEGVLEGDAEGRAPETAPPDPAVGVPGVPTPPDPVPPGEAVARGDEGGSEVAGPQAAMAEVMRSATARRPAPPGSRRRVGRREVPTGWPGSPPQRGRIMGHGESTVSLA